ncbi:3-oxoacyl-[acyl-carrier-protein] synthase III C-terminal domain-containing protein [Facilibium subflavum]|uniref:3-oxoacyl-[acyl-carrier-protein] synthase III C-terminal domain-containing protein n=1 Tax=Facilibium subflavum TaxID=2219058 RepID=UPI000E652740|nr:3-oxoacyl-[acyl-carrier-protein] synthase III C-terminal domain-containing protein [Facilibium subflavum]
MKILSIDYHLSEAERIKEIEHPNKMQLEAIQYAGYDQFWKEPNGVRQMTSAAAMKAILSSNLQPEDIAFIVAGQSGIPDYIGIDLACQVGAELDCSDVRTVNLVESCGSGISVWFHAASLVSALPTGRVGLVVVAQRVSDAHQDRFGVMNAVLSDGAAAAVVVSDEWPSSVTTIRYLAGDDISDCRYVDMMRVEYGGGRQPVLPDWYDIQNGKLGRERIMDLYKFKPDDLQAFLTLRANNNIKIIERVTSQLGRNLKNPFLLQTLEGIQSIKSLCDRLSIPYERSNLSLLSKLGHVGCADLLISLKMILDQDDIKPGDDIIMSTISTGLKWGAAIFQYGESKIRDVCNQ